MKIPPPPPINALATALPLSICVAFCCEYILHGSICESKCESGFGWTTVPQLQLLLTGFGQRVRLSISHFPCRPQSNYTLEEKELGNAWGRPAVSQGEAGY